MSKQKRIKASVETIREYLQLMNGVMGLTETELDVLEAFIKCTLHIEKNNLNMNPFSTEMKKRVAKSLGRDNFHTLNNYIMTLKEKSAIQKTVDGYAINPILMPQGEDELVFEI